MTDLEQTIKQKRAAIQALIAGQRTQSHSLQQQRVGGARWDNWSNNFSNWNNWNNHPR